MDIPQYETLNFSSAARVRTAVECKVSSCHLVAYLLAGPNPSRLLLQSGVIRSVRLNLYVYLYLVAI
jgi:hypothetical protein